MSISQLLCTDLLRAMVEIGQQLYNLFEGLMAEKGPVCKAVASLNTVRWKGHKNICLMEVPEDNGVVE
jgi:hypothetical protein